MKKLTFAFGLLCLLVAVIRAADVQTVDFTGIWVLDKGKSKSLAGTWADADYVELMVKQDG